MRKQQQIYEFVVCWLHEVARSPGGQPSHAWTVYWLHHLAHQEGNHPSHGGVDRRIDWGYLGQVQLLIQFSAKTTKPIIVKCKYHTQLAKLT